MNKFLLLLIFLTSIGNCFAQNTASFFGKVIDSKTQKPLDFVVVSIQNSSVMQLTNLDGTFSFITVPSGNLLVLIRSHGFKDALYPLELAPGDCLDLGIIILEDDQFIEQQNSIVTLLESDLSDQNGSSESTSALLHSSRDVFLQAAAFNWGQARFRVRGLDSEHNTMMINGVSMNKIYDNRPQWSEWGGLNDALRNQEFTLGTTPSEYTFGGILGTQHLNTRASLYRLGSRITLSGTNTNYNWRSMATHASGINSRGWAYVLSIGKRATQEGYYQGTNYNAHSFFISLEKKISERHSLNLTGIYTPNTRAKNSANTAEVTNLTTLKYNSYWGFQDGKRRNSRIKTVEVPLFMLNHYFKINDKTNWNSSATYQFGKTANSNLDYQNANSPDPTYYRKMPSYYSSMYAKDNGEFSGEFIPDYQNSQKSTSLFLTHPQINWDAIYQANQSPVVDLKGSILGYESSKSKYVLYEDRVEDLTSILATNLNSQLSENISLNVGATFKKLKSHYSQYLLDLLGGSYFEDIDPFYKGNQSQSNLNTPNRQVVVGDTYGYNYNYFATTLQAFTQFKFTYDKIDFYMAQHFAWSTYQREGLYKNGIYPTNSFGKSENLNFENFGFKAGLNLKISGKKGITFNLAHATKAPSLRNSFANSRLNNTIVDNLESEIISSVDLSYVYRSPKLKSRITTYYSLIKKATQISFFYAEGIFDDGSGYLNTDAFVSQALTQLDKKNIGAEISLECQLSSTLKTTCAIALGSYTYASDPQVTLTNDAKASLENTNPIFDFGKPALKNYKQAGMPQQAYSIGLEYRDPQYWWVGTNMNCLTNTYLDVAPISRTQIFYKNPASGFNFPEATQERAQQLLKQEKFEPVLLLNLVGGKSWRIYKKNVGVFTSVNNVLDFVYKTGGYQQARNANFRKINQDISSGTPSFGNKYFYGYGRTFFINLYLNF